MCDTTLHSKMPHSIVDGHNREIRGRAAHNVSSWGTGRTSCVYGVSVKSMAVLESDEQLRLLIASSDGYIKLYDVDVEVCDLQ